MILALITSESAHPIIQVEQLKQRFWHNLKFVYYLVVNTTNIYHMLLTISYSESMYLITPVEPLKASLYDYFGISVYFVYFIFI